MPLSIMQKLGLEEPKPTNVSLQLADRSMTYLKGIVEDVPLILGRPFFAIERAMIDVQ